MPKYQCKWINNSSVDSKCMQGYYWIQFGCDMGVFVGGGVFRCPSGLSCCRLKPAAFDN